MSIRDRLGAAVDALLGISAYERPADSSSATLDSPQVQRTRKSMGGQLAPPPTSQVRFYLRDLESAQYCADGGDMGPAARLVAAAYTDGIYSGVIDTLTGGIGRLPRIMHGPAEMIAQLNIGHDSIRSVFDEMVPPSELSLLIRDGFELGVGVAELVPVRGRDFPIMVRLDPANLYYRWTENRWYYNSLAGTIPITPGDGRWVLHTPGGRIAPWRNGKWRAVCRAYIPKEHSRLAKDNWEMKLANAARVAVAPGAATDAQVGNWFTKVAAWGLNTVFATRPGYDVKLVEGNGKGWESFEKTADRSDKEYQIIVAGQIGTTEGGVGFSNKDLFEVVRIDRIEQVASSIAYTLNTQVLPQWAVTRYGQDALDTPVVCHYDTRRPKDRKAEADAMLIAASATSAWRQELTQHNVVAADGTTHTPKLDIATITKTYNVPISGDVDNDGIPDEPANDEARALKSAENTAIRLHTGLIAAVGGRTAHEAVAEPILREVHNR